MKICHNCGHENAETSAFCNQCGTKLQTYKKCPACGEVIMSSAAKFCNLCGTPLNGAPMGGALMGDKNVISGDVSSTINNVTTYINQNDAQTTVSCYVCGKTLSKGSGDLYKCKVCGKYVCAAHIDHGSHKCMNCLKADKKSAEIDMLRAFEVEARANGKYGIIKLCDHSALSLTIPNIVESIEQDAFAESNVIRIELPNSIILIGDRAFKNCRSLRQINLPDSLLYIGNEAFCGCERLEVVPPKGADLGTDAFKGTIVPKKETKPETPNTNTAAPTTSTQTPPVKMVLKMPNGESVPISPFVQEEYEKLSRAMDANREYVIQVKDTGSSKLMLIKIVREYYGLGLKEAKDLVESFPKHCLTIKGKEKADRLLKELAECGAKAEIVK